jgi:hypothetical protein
MGVLEPTKVKFYRHALIPNENGCILWKGLASKKWPDGYGKIRIKGGKQIAAHRFSYEMHNGIIAEGLHVLHKCDTPRCVAPQHLFLGTASDNMKDRSKKNRCNNAKGENNYLANFTNEIANRIRAIHKEGSSLRKIAKQFNTTYNTIWKIVNKQSYNNF